MVERRHSIRLPVNVPLTFTTSIGSSAPGVARDVSLGGMLIETPAPAAFGAEIVVSITFPGRVDPMTLPGIVRWVHDGAIGVQFGLLGARATHAITELIARHRDPSESRLQAAK